MSIKTTIDNKLAMDSTDWKEFQERANRISMLISKTIWESYKELMDLVELIKVSISKGSGKDPLRNPPEYTLTQMNFTIIFWLDKSIGKKRVTATWTLENNRIEAFVSHPDIDNESCLIPFGNGYYCPHNATDNIPASIVLATMHLICKRDSVPAYHEAKVLNDVGDKFFRLSDRLKSQ